MLKTTSVYFVQLLTLCLLGEFACFFCCLLIFFKIVFFEKLFPEYYQCQNSLYPDQAQHFVWHDLGPNCLQRLSADGTNRNYMIRDRKCVSQYSVDSSVFLFGWNVVFSLIYKSFSFLLSPGLQHEKFCISCTFLDNGYGNFILMGSQTVVNISLIHKMIVLSWWI